MLDNTTATSSALNTEQLLTVDTPTLCKLLCCGRYTAIQIGNLAPGRVTVDPLARGGRARTAAGAPGKHVSKQKQACCHR